MSEQQKETLVQLQVKTKPKIEEIIPEYLDGEVKQSLIELLEFCGVNGIKYPWSATNRWKLKLKGETIGMIYIGKNPCLPGGENFEKNIWYTAIYMKEKFVREKNLTEVIYKNVLPCVRGEKTCKKSDTVTIFGKEFKGACKDSGRRFMNPDAETLDCIKKWLKQCVQ